MKKLIVYCLGILAFICTTLMIASIFARYRFEQITNSDISSFQKIEETASWNKYAFVSVSILASVAGIIGVCMIVAGIWYKKHLTANSKPSSSQSDDNIHQETKP